MENISRQAPNSLVYPLRMLRHLRLHGLTKMEELATVLDVTPRQIRRYFYALRETGYPVKSRAGKAGGYYLDEPEIHPAEWEILKSALANYPDLFKKLEWRLLLEFQAEGGGSDEL